MDMRKTVGLGAMIVGAGALAVGTGLFGSHVYMICENNKQRESILSKQSDEYRDVVLLENLEGDVELRNQGHFYQGIMAAGLVAVGAGYRIRKGLDFYNPNSQAVGA